MCVVGYLSRRTYRRIRRKRRHNTDQPADQETLPDGSGGRIGFTRNTNSIADDTTNNLYFTVIRNGSSVGSTSVDYATINGSAIAGVDYVATSGTLNWEDGDSTSRIIAVPIILTTGTVNSTFTLNLSLNENSGQAVLSTAITIVTIIRRGPGYVSLPVVLYEVEDPITGSVNISLSIHRYDGNKGNVSIQYATADGTATAGLDYTSTSGTLSWNNRENDYKTITIPILGRSGTQGTRSFTFTLSNPTGGLQIAGIASLTVNIIEAPASNSTYGIPRYQLLQDPEFYVREDYYAEEAYYRNSYILTNDVLGAEINGVIGVGTAFRNFDASLSASPPNRFVIFMS